MKTCTFCGEGIQETALKCRYCGEFLDGGTPTRIGSGLLTPGLFWGYEYRSRAEFLGWPLVHVAYGMNPRTGLPRVAKGILAIGNFAIGLVVIGGFAAGGLTLAGIGLGAFILGGIAVGLVFALGGLAVSYGFAIGGLGLAPRSIDLNSTLRDIPSLVAHLLKGR